ncbi:hypothetical protein EI94DRAFT_1801507 [Lactarius quietus]|nr:hypothetical protein EI94DRAFT_1801507 [Lactarius quietus]
MPALTILTSVPPPFLSSRTASPSLLALHSRPPAHRSLSFLGDTVPRPLRCRSLSSRLVFPSPLAHNLLTLDFLGPPFPDPLASPLRLFLFNLLGPALATPHAHPSALLTLPSAPIALATFLTLALPRLITLSSLPSPWPTDSLSSFSARHTVVGGFFPDDVKNGEPDGVFVNPGATLLLQHDVRVDIVGGLPLTSFNGKGYVTSKQPAKLERQFSSRAARHSVRCETALVLVYG